MATKSSQYWPSTWLVLPNTNFLLPCSASQPSLLPTLRGSRSVTVEWTLLVLSLHHPSLHLLSHTGLEGLDRLLTLLGLPFTQLQ